MFPTTEELYVMFRDVLDNPDVQAIGGWACGNHDGPTDEPAYLEKAKADIGAFSECVDEVLAEI